MKIEPTRLQGPHLVLEPLEERHLDELAAVYAPGIWQWYTVRIASPAALRTFLAGQLNEQRQHKTLVFAIRDRSSGALAGASRFLNLDAPNRRLEIGSTWYAPKWQRTCANTEAKLLMLTHAFDALDCIAVQLQTDVLNERSRRASASARSSTACCARTASARTAASATARSTASRSRIGRRCGRS